MKRSPSKKKTGLEPWIISLILAPGLFLSTTQLSFASPIQTRSLPPRIHAVSDAVLDQMRGGFSAGGMNFSLGIQSATFVNGQMMVQTIIHSVGNALVASIGSNPFNAQTLATMNSVNAGSSQNGSANSIVPVRSTSIGSPVSVNGFPSISIISSSIPGAANNAVSFAVQISPTKGGSGNFLLPTSFSGAQGVISVLQNTANNVSIHRVINMNATVSNVRAVNNSFILNNMLASGMILHR